YAPYAARFAPLLNLRNRLPALAAIGEKLFSISARRSLPNWSPRPYPGAEIGVRASRPQMAGGTAALRNNATAYEEREVVLLVDTFNRYFEPENAEAAERVLTRAGYRVTTPEPGVGRPLCCGRTFLAAGLVDEAKTDARRMLDALAPAIAAGTPIIGLE